MAYIHGTPPLMRMIETQGRIIEETSGSIGIIIIHVNMTS